MISIVEVDGNEFSDTLNHFNSLDDCFPPLSESHLTDGYWWLAFAGAEVIAFAGLVSMEPFTSCGYLKRCYVLPDYRGRGLQSRFLKIREDKARELGWATLVSECSESNLASAANFKRAGYEITDPEQKWATRSVYFVKRL